MIALRELADDVVLDATDEKEVVELLLMEVVRDRLEEVRRSEVPSDPLSLATEEAEVGVVGVSPTPEGSFALGGTSCT